MPRTRGSLAIAAVCAAVTACGSAAQQPEGAGPASVPPAASAPAADSAGAGCPLSADDLSSATSLSWDNSDTRTDHPLETQDAVTGTTCLFTAPDHPQSGGDPLVLRVDVVTGADAETVHSAFERTCTQNGGRVTDSVAAVGARVCQRDGTVVEGTVSGSGRTVDVYFVNADTTTATRLTQSFDEILGAVR
jgi:hypothetical protein